MKEKGILLDRIGGEKKRDITHPRTLAEGAGQGGGSKFCTPIQGF